jgi:hypothetical protein
MEVPASHDAAMPRSFHISAEMESYGLRDSVAGQVLSGMALTAATVSTVERGVLTTTMTR